MAVNNKIVRGEDEGFNISKSLVSYQEVFTIKFKALPGCIVFDFIILC